MTAPHIRQPIDSLRVAKRTLQKSECGMDTACVMYRTPARSSFVVARPLSTSRLEQSGAGFGEQFFQELQRFPPSLRCCNGPGPQTPVRFSFSGICD